MKNGARGRRRAALALACVTTTSGCFLGGDYKGGGRTILITGWDASGGAASSTVIEVDAGAPPVPTTDASAD